MSGLKAAMAREEGEAGFSVIAQIKTVYDKKTLQGTYGEYSVQNIIAQDIEDNSVSCQFGLSKMFLDKDAVGSIFTFKNCKKKSYKSTKTGAMVPNFECKEFSEGASEVKAAVAAQVARHQAAPTVYPSAPKVDWDKKDLMIARESALKSAATIISAQIQASLVNKDINMIEYSMRMAEFFVKFIYDGVTKAPVETEEIEVKEDLDKKLSIIKTIQAAQTRYGLNITNILEIVKNKFGLEVDLLQDLSCGQLNELLVIIINTKALKKEEPKVDKEDITDDSLL